MVDKHVQQEYLDLVQGLYEDAIATEPEYLELASKLDLELYNISLDNELVAKVISRLMVRFMLIQEHTEERFPDNPKRVVELLQKSFLIHGMAAYLKLKEGGASAEGN